MKHRYRIQSFLFTSLACLLALVVLSTDAWAARGRPVVDSSMGYNRLLSDQGTLLRGVSISWDGGDPYGTQPKFMPSQASLNALATDYGLNTVHLYLEGDSSQNTNPVGYNSADCDTLVQRCATAGLYLIITIGCNGENGAIHSMQFIQDFWNFYGPRYKNDTHVIYEAKNEPVAHTAGHWTQADWDNQVTMYNTIRPTAPDTYILLFSYMGFNNGGAAINAVNYLEAQGVDWGYAGVAWHGYTSIGAIEDATNAFKASLAYPATLCTEFWPGDTVPESAQDESFNGTFETHYTGWMQFQYLAANDDEMPGFAYKIEQGGVVWTPDVASCDWPTLGSPVIPANGSTVGIFDRGEGKFVGLLSNNDLTANLSNYTGNQNDEFTIAHSGDGLVSFQAANGLYVSSSGETDALTANSSTVGSTEKFEWFELPNGDVVLRAYGSGGHLINSKSKKGKKVILPDADDASSSATNYAFVDGSSPSGPPPAPQPQPEPDPGPYFGSPQPIPGVIEGKDYDFGGQGVAYNDSEADNFGGFYRPTEGVDIEASSEGGSSLGWVDSGEWMNYTVDVASSGNYTITTRYAGNGSFHIEFDGVDKTGTVTAPESGGWQSWADASVSVSLSAGVQEMRFVTNGGCNIRNFTITSGGGGGPVCGDGTCDVGEDQCNCSNDCGTPPSSESNCTDGEDEDCDGDTDCDDADCSGDAACQSVCDNDGVCEPGEDCDNCGNDCDSVTGGRPTNRYCCGNGVLEGPEGDGRCDGNI
jgi:hypothetical protein